LLAGILAAHPQTRGVLLDLPHVAAMPGSPSRRPACRRVAASRPATSSAKSPHSATSNLLRKVIHDWDDDGARRILSTCRSAMTDGSRLLLLEMVVPTGNTPAYAKLLDLLMLAYAGGRERSEAEYRDLLMSAGFSVKRIVPTASAISIIEARPGQAAGPAG
jgi:hypothetical protein